MNKPGITSPSLISDPRLDQDFIPERFPLSNGKKGPPPGSEERSDLIKIEFLSVYYRLNHAYSELLKVRASSPENKIKSEREALRAVETILIARDELEDLHAPAGVLAQPVVKDGFTVDITFAFGHVDSRGRPRNDQFRLAAQFPVPLPPGVKLEQFIVDFQGPEPYMPLPE